MWQAGYFERVLRDDEPELPVARYIIENPVRAGLVTSAGSYPLTGSSRYSIAQISRCGADGFWPPPLARLNGLMVLL